MFRGGLIVVLLRSIQANWAAELLEPELVAFVQRLRGADPPVAASPGLGEAVPSNLAHTPSLAAAIDAALEAGE